MVVPKLQTVASSASPLAAAHALWTLVRINSQQSKQAITAGAKHGDWKVRRLTLKLLTRYEVPSASAVARSLTKDSNASVRIATVIFWRWSLLKNGTR